MQRSMTIVIVKRREGLWACDAYGLMFRKPLFFLVRQQLVDMLWIQFGHRLFFGAQVAGAANSPETDRTHQTISNCSDN